MPPQGPRSQAQRVPLKWLRDRLVPKNGQRTLPHQNPYGGKKTDPAIPMVYFPPGLGKPPDHLETNTGLPI